MYSPKRRFRLFRSPAFAGFNPALYGTLSLWLDAADILGTGANPANGTTVTTWYDKSGNARNATSSGTPKLASTGLGGTKPSINLLATSQQYFTGPITNGGTTVTSFVVATESAAGALNTRLVSLGPASGQDYGSTAYIIPFLKSAGSGTAQLGSFRGGPGAFKDVADDTPFYASLVSDTLTDTIYVNGVVGTPLDTVNNALTYTTYGIGNDSGKEGNYWTGYVSEVLVYNSALSTTNRQAVEAYLATKWGI